MDIFGALRPFIFCLDAERAHRLSIAALKFMPPVDPVFDPVLQLSLAGLNFPNPVGLAAGYDKDAEVPGALISLGFGFVEVGTLTPKAQSGNSKPRLFRLWEDEAVINRMGFNNQGQDAALQRLKAARRGIIGVNIGANKESVDRIADYASGVAKMACVADYLTINISSPNTPGLRALQDEAALTALLSAVSDARPVGGPAVFLKLAPDLDPSDIDTIVRAATGQVDALIISNTTISRPVLRSKHAAESGGLSGAPLKSLAQQCLVDFRTATGGKIPLIAAGGIGSADDAYARIRAGASLVQLYSALVYQGPGLARRINAGLKQMLVSDGFANVSDAIGVDAR